MQVRSYNNIVVTDITKHTPELRLHIFRGNHQNLHMATSLDQMNRGSDLDELPHKVLIDKMTGLVQNDRRRQCSTCEKRFILRTTVDGRREIHQQLVSFSYHLCTYKGNYELLPRCISNWNRTNTGSTSYACETE